MSSSTYHDAVESRVLALTMLAVLGSVTTVLAHQFPANCAALAVSPLLLVLDATTMSPISTGATVCVGQHLSVAVVISAPPGGCDVSGGSLSVSYPGQDPMACNDLNNCPCDEGVQVPVPLVCTNSTSNGAPCTTDADCPPTDEWNRGLCGIPVICSPGSRGGIGEIPVCEAGRVMPAPDQCCNAFLSPSTPEYVVNPADAQLIPSDGKLVEFTLHYCNAALHVAAGERELTCGFNVASGLQVAVGCAGDCLGDNQVTVDEILTVVNIALGSADMAACESIDLDGNGQVTVDEILTAVDFALGGCPPAPPGCQ